MAILRIKYNSNECIASCKAGEVELQNGEEVKITLKPKSELWPEFIKAYLAQPAYGENGERVYLLDFDDEQLNGGAIPDACDLGTPECWGCCDENADEIEALKVALANLQAFVDPDGDGDFDVDDVAGITDLINSIVEENINNLDTAFTPSQIQEITNLINDNTTTITTLPASSITGLTAFVNALIPADNDTTYTITENGILRGSDGSSSNVIVEATNVANLCASVTECVEKNSDTRSSIRELIESLFESAPTTLINAVQCVISDSIESIDTQTCETLTPLYLGVGEDGKRYIRFQDANESLLLNITTFDDDLDGTSKVYYGADLFTGTPIFGDGVSTRSLGETTGQDRASGDLSTNINILNALSSNGKGYNSALGGWEYDLSDLPDNLITVESDPIVLKCDTLIDYKVNQGVSLNVDGDRPRTGGVQISWSNDGGATWFFRTINSTPNPSLIGVFTDYVSSETDEGTLGNFDAGTWIFRYHIISNGAFLRSAGDPTNGGVFGNALNVKLTKSVS